MRKPLPALLVPVAAVGADRRDVSGLLHRVVTPPGPVDDSRGTGDRGGVGDGAGVGQGTGGGVGAGDGGGTGGGPYRPGSGIAPPGLLREVAPDYTDRARRAGLQGEVLLTMVVTAEGLVTDVQVRRGLGSGLDERAVAAVQQWSFSPALRHGLPVAVWIEVAVEFRLRQG
ncbi:MAG: energy transducer TonB [Acidobacteria bacterium]|nr:energy transducer TonB [Acidobacteriota bacterium]